MVRIWTIGHDAAAGEVLVIVVSLAMIGCRSENGLSLPQGEELPLGLTVAEPVYGAFVGDRTAVSGKVSDPAATVWIEGYRAQVGSDGTFRVEVPVTGDFRVIDVEAVRATEHLRERRPVFSGADPMASWTGGLGLRVTPVALDHVAEIVAEQIDALDLPGQIDALLPSFALGGFTFAPTGTTARPAEVTIVSSDEGIALTVTVPELELGFEVASPTVEPFPVVLGLDTLTLGVGVTLGIDGAGDLAVGISDTTLALGAPILVFGGIEPTILESWAAGLTAGLGLLLEGVFDLGTALLGDFSVPFSGFETDALGFPLSLSLADAGTDVDGVGLLLGVDLGTPPASPLVLPTLVDAGPAADLALSVHEGLIQGLLGSELLALLDLDLELPGFLGEIVALPITALPGGDQLPDDRTGMCLSLVPGEARVARLKEDLAPLAVLTMPDVLVGVGVSTPTGRCTPWIDASLAVEVAFDAEDTALLARFAVVDGAVLAYGAEGSFDEDELVGGLGGLVDVATSLLGANLAIDLSTLFGTGTASPVGDLAPRLLDATAGSAEGEVVIAISLWD